MTLQFNAPYQIDPNRNPDQEGLDRISQALGNISGTTDRWVQEDRQKKLQDLQMLLMKNKEAREAEEWGLKKPIEYGTGVGGVSSGPDQNMTPSQPMVQSNPFGGGIPEGPGQNMTPDVSQPQVGGMIEKFRQWQSQNRSGQAIPQASQPTSVFPGLSPEEMSSANQFGTKRSELYAKAAEQKRLFQEEARKQRETALKEKYGPGSGKGTWHLNQFTGQYDFYPNTGPANGMPNPVGTPAPTGPNAPAPIPFKERSKMEAESRENDVLVDSVIKEIDRVKILNQNARGGYGGAALQSIQSATNMGTDSKGFKNTADVINTMQNQVARVLKSTFGGQLSDDERKYLNTVYGALPHMSNTERDIAMTNVKTIMLNKRDALRAKAGLGGANQGGGQSGGRIKVSNGVETRWIDPSDAAEAAKDGYQ